MHAHLRAAGRLAGALTIVLPTLLAGCTTDQPTASPPGTSEPPLPAGLDAARDELAALAAAAQDRHQTAGYTLSAADGRDRSVLVTSAADDSWRVDVPGGALGGTVDISLAATADGLFQCALPSAGRPDPPSCVRLGDRDDTVPRTVDPRVEHPFTDWLQVLTDRRAPLAVSPAKAPAGTTGACYSVESTSASLNSPLDVGIYCYAPDGTLTLMRTALGTLKLAGTPASPPDTVQLAGPVVDGEPLGTAAPDPTESPSAGTS